MKNPWIIVGVIAIALFGGAIWYSNFSASQSNENILISPHVTGSLEASVSLVEYSDLQCPACAAFEPVLAGVLEHYQDQIRFEFKHFPLPARIHPHAFPAAIAAEAAGQQGKFFEFKELLYSNQKTWSAAAVPTSYFVQYASDLGLDLELFRNHLRSSALKERVQKELAEGEALGVSGTPTFFLNGEKMQFQSYEEFVTQVGVAIDPSLAASSTATTSADVAEVRFGI